MALDPRLHGIYCALVTPLEPDGRTVNADVVRQVVDYVVSGGCTGLVVLGGTGEYTALAPYERERAVALAVEHNQGRVPVVVGVVAPGLADAREMARFAERSGADYVMPVTPYYVSPTQEGIAAWYHEFAEATTVPVILYNIPSRTRVNLLPETVVQLASDIDHLVGIKECNTSLLQFAELIELAGERLAVLSGEDHYALPELLAGARGAILASANTVPAHWSRLFNALEAGDVEEACRINLQLTPFLNAIFSECNPGPLKASMRELGFPVGPVAKPLLDPNANVVDRISGSLATLELAIA